MCFCHKNLCECISLTQRARRGRDAEFLWFTQNAQTYTEFLSLAKGAEL